MVFVRMACGLPRESREQVNVLPGQPPIYDDAEISASNDGGQVEQFDLATSGALWVAIGA